MKFVGDKQIVRFVIGSEDFILKCFLKLTREKNNKMIHLPMFSIQYNNGY